MKRTLKHTYAIVVDGSTERWYLDMLKRNERDKLTINISPFLSTQMSIEEQYEKVIELSENNAKVYWIIDYDTVIKETRESKSGVTVEQKFIELREKALKTENISVIVNTPCLEFWLLLHYKKTAKFHDKCAPIEKELKKHLTDYQKTKKYYTKQGNDIYLKLKDKLKTAIDSNSKGLKFDPLNTKKATCEMRDLFIDILK